MSSGFSKAFNALTFVRNLVLNLMFLAFVALSLIMLVVLFKGGDKTLVMEKDSTLVLDLDGTLVERPTQNALDRSISLAMGQDVQDEIVMVDLVRVLKAVPRDDRIKQVYIRMDQSFSSGMAQTRELASMIYAIKKSGKKVTVFGNSFSQNQYLLASAANKIYLDPEGAVLIEGLSRYRQYFREALEDKLGVTVHLFRVGEFKSAAEPFIRDDASEESKKADLYWMNDIWQRYLNDVAVYRGLSRSNLETQVNSLASEITAVNGNLAGMALKQKLVDKLITEEEVERELMVSYNYESIHKSLPAPVSMNHYLRSLDQRDAMSAHRSDRVGLVVAQGQIVDGEGGSEDAGGETVAKEINLLRNDPSVKALVLRVDSPGGAVFASEQIRREVDLFKRTGRPVVVSMGNTAASGGYWVSMDADKIYADASTVTGSIGIFGLIPEVSTALNKLGVRTDGVGTTKLAGGFDPTRPLDKELSVVIQKVIDNGYLKFINRVGAARDMSVTEVNEVARGRVWSGAQAKDRRLVDGLGGLSDAIQHAMTLAKLKELHLATPKNEVPLFAKILMDLNGEASSYRMTAWASPHLVQWAALMRQPEVKMITQSLNQRMPQAYAHCMCGL